MRMEKNGIVTKYDEFGNKESASTFKNGVKEGLSFRWYKNGQKAYEGNFKDGNEEGIQVAWHENGKKMAEGNANDQTRDKESQKFWNSKGEPVDSFEEAQK